MTKRSRRTCCLVVALLSWTGGSADAGDLYVGSATTSITPSRPVALSGQRHTRIARNVQTPVTATAVAMETRDRETSLGQAVMVSCDLVAIRSDIQDQVRRRVRSRLPELEAEKLFLNATHTHTAPVMLEGRYRIPDDVMQPEEYVEFLVGRISDVIVRAWESRSRGRVGWGIGHAVVGRNRRAVYANGSAKMYGGTDGPGFRGLEGVENHIVDALFFWSPENRLTATAVAVACPAQEVEGRSSVNADYWHPVREALRERFQEDLRVLGWIGAAGDQSPHLMFYEEAERRMRKLRGLSRLEEITRRIDRAVAEAYAGAEKDVRHDVRLDHVVRDIELPMRMVTEKEYKEAKAIVERVEKKEDLDAGDRMEAAWNQRTVDRYRRQQKADDRLQYEMELHVVRLGDVAICTNPFELYTKYGIEMKARSKATQTLVVQLSTASGLYLPTRRAVRGGGYSAEVFSNLVGPEGGEVLVDRTVETINSLWE